MGGRIFYTLEIIDFPLYDLLNITCAGPFNTAHEQDLHVTYSVNREKHTEGSRFKSKKLFPLFSSY